MPEQKKYRFLFSAGGSGGHIFPALATANRLRKDHPDAEFLFIGAKGKMEMEKVPEAGYEIKGLNISGIERSSLLKNFSWPFKLLGSLISALSMIRKYKPHVAAGFGGFASGPALYASSLLGIPCLIQEQNSFAGITNRLLGGKVQVVCTAYEGMDKFFPSEKIHLLGNPIRDEIKESRISREDGIAHFEFQTTSPLIFAFGGSQGALAINEAIRNNLEELGRQDLQMIWQTGPSFFSEAVEALQKAQIKNVKAFPFIKEMDKAYAASDMVICRSGAISISELAIVEKPVLFVPLPTAAEDHQTKNAMALVRKGAASMLSNSEVSEKLIPKILDLFKNDQKRSSMSQAIKGFARPEATLSIAEKILELAA
jgi:UDP-N-acetylglucosamine--N-acetylmuramyl-(pentapeptide) pyrophosphoryl-undecaprenol N-acetylglucosamine transferase